MILYEYDEALHERTLREEGREEGRVIGRSEEREKNIQSFITSMKKFKIEKETARMELIETFELSEDVVDKYLEKFW